MNSFESIGQLTEAILQCLGRHRLLSREKPPISNRRRIRDVSGQLDFCAGEACREVIERPLVVGQQSQVGLDILDQDLAWRTVGGGNRHNQPPPVQHQQIDLQLKPR